MATVARWLEEIEPGLLAAIILLETGDDYTGRDLLDQVVRADRDFRFGGSGSDRRLPVTRARRLRRLDPNFETANDFDCIHGPEPPSAVG